MFALSVDGLKRAVSDNALIVERHRFSFLSKTQNFINWSTPISLKPQLEVCGAVAETQNGSNRS